MNTEKSKLESQQEQSDISVVMNIVLSELDKLERLAAIDMKIKLSEGNINGYAIKIGERIGIKDCINIVKNIVYNG